MSNIKLHQTTSNYTKYKTILAQIIQLLQLLHLVEYSSNFQDKKKKKKKNPFKRKKNCTEIKEDIEHQTTPN